MPQSFPDETELVSCTITSVQSHSVFVRIEKYGINGMIHISEVAPGRIRNIRDYVVEGKNVICKVLKVNPERGHVDLSLRRVSDSQRRNKINELKKEKLAEKLIEVVASNLDMDKKDLYKRIFDKSAEHFYLLFEGFSEIAKGTFDVKDFKLPKNIAAELKKVIQDRLKPEFVITRGKLSLASYAPDGVEIVKAALKLAVSAGATVKYTGGGIFSLSVKAPEYKKAETILENSADAAIKYINSKGGEGEFVEAS